MKHTIAFSLGIALLGAGTAHAQRAPIDRSDRRAQRQQMMQGMTPEQRQQLRQNGRQQRNNARPNSQNTGNGFTQNGAGQWGQGGTAGGQRGQGQAGNTGRTRTRGGDGNTSNATLTTAERETLMRGLMKSAGITDKAQQDPIVAFVFAQSKAREPLLKSAREIATSLRDGKTKPDQISAKWTVYQAAVDQDKARFEKELADLDEKIGWSKDARLQSFLSLVGVLGPDTFVIGGAVAIFGPEPQPQVHPVSTRTTTTPNAANAAAPRAN